MPRGEYCLITVNKFYSTLYFYYYFLGKYVNHKGRSRHFTSPEELEEARKAEEAKKK